MRKEKGERHRYGRHYTPDQVARLLAAFAVQSPADLVLDPSCGDGRLLREALSRKVALEVMGTERNGSGYAGAPKTGGGQASPGADTSIRSDEVFGIDRDAAAVQLAAATGAHVACGDFFDLSPGQRLNKDVTLPVELDGIIGNPPYIRQEVMGASDKQRIALSLARPPDKPMDRGMAAAPEMPGLYWPRWSGRSDIYVYFFAHSASFLKPGGRLVFITASSWLDVGYGAPLQQFFLNNFRIVAVIESAVESFFEDASVNTAITVLEREPDRAARDHNSARFVQLLGPVDEICSDAIEFSSFVRSAEDCLAPGELRIRSFRQANLRTELEGTRSEPFSEPYSARPRNEPVAAVGNGGSNWGKYLRASNVFFSIVERGGERLRKLSDLASVRFGVKTGANEFFYVTADRGSSTSPEQSAEPESGSDGRTEGRVSDVRGAGMLPLLKMASVRRGLTTGANEFFYVKAVDEDDSDAGGEKKCARHPEGHLSADSSGSKQDGDKLKLIGHMVVEDGLGARHVIESRFLSPVLFSLKEISGVIIEPGQASRLFFNCSAPPGEMEASNALDYVRAGERAGYNSRPSCATRNPWYAIARDRRPAPLIFPSKVGERWVVALNQAGVYEDKKLYGIYPSADVQARTLAALLNSTWSRYYAEMTCRQMTGAQAIADIDVVVAEQILLPDPRTLSCSHQERLESALRDLSRRPVVSIFEEVKLPDRRSLDDLVLETIGFTEKPEREAVLDQLYTAVLELVRRRLSRSRKATPA